MPSIWNAGIETFDKILADREQARMLAEDRARRDALDAEQRDYRDSMLDLQRRQQANAEERQVQAGLESRLQRDRDAEKEERVRKFTAIAFDPSQSEEIRRQAAAQLAADGVSGATITAGLNVGAKPKMQKRQILDSRGNLVREIEAPEGTSFQTLPEPDRGPQMPVSHRDNPNLPQGVMNWINSIAQRQVPLAQARKELSQGWQMQMAAHPNADLGTAAKYLDTLFPNGMNLFGRQETAPPAAETPAVAAPATAPRGPRGVTDAQMATGMGLGNGPVPPVPPQAATPAAGITDELAIAELQRRGREITPESIAMAKQILASQAR